MTDPVIPPKIVQDAARALRSGEHLIAEVLAAVLVDLRAVGWSVEPPPLRWGWSERHAGIAPAEPAEKWMSRSPFVGEVVIYGGDGNIGLKPHPAVFVPSDLGPTLHVFGERGPYIVRNVSRTAWRFADQPYQGVRIDPPTQKG